MVCTDFLSKVFFIRQSEIIYDQAMCSFTSSLSNTRTHLFCSLSLFFYVLDSVTKYFKKLLTLL